MAVCLYFFPPSPKLEPYLDGYINRHRDPGLNFTEVAKWPIHVRRLLDLDAICCPNFHFFFFFLLLGASVSLRHD
jgi:hypothetical protein